MKIESITIRNYKALRSIQVDKLPDFLVVVGANGTGKSTLFDVFGFLRDCLTFNVSRALQSRGGFKEVVSRGAADESIRIEVQYRMLITGKNRLVTYSIEVANEGGRAVVVDELLRYKRGAYGQPYHFLRFSRGVGFAITNEEDFDKPDEELSREDQTLESPDILALKGVGQFRRFKAANALRKLLEDWHVSDFHIEAARGSKDAAGYGDHLSASGDNLQLVANRLYEEHRNTAFAKIVEIMKRRVPGIASIEPISSPDGRLLLGFRDGSFKDPFVDRWVSDGTIKMFAYLVLLYDPEPHELLCIEEPENQLYPSLLPELAEELRAYARRGGQVFVSTHSPELLNACATDEVFWLRKTDGFATIHRASEDPQLRAYMADGDKMGFLWKQGFFEGADPA